MSLVLGRQITDNSLLVTKAYPAANNNNNSASIDLGASAGAHLSPEEMDLQIQTPALTTTQLPDTNTITYTVQDSADNVTFAEVTSKLEYVITGAGGAGHAADKKNFRLPPDIRRYVRINQAVSAGAGDCTGLSSTLALTF